MCLAGIIGINWVPVLCLPDQGDVSYVFSAEGGAVETICSQVSLVREAEVPKFTKWLEVVQIVWPCLIIWSQSPHSASPGTFLASTILLQYLVPV